MSKKIIFESCFPWFNEVAPKPISASQVLPEWFKKMAPYMPDAINKKGKHLSIFDKQANASAKKCTPMLDALTSGYIIPLWSDVYVDASNKFDTPIITWRTSQPIFEQHGNQSQEVGTPFGYHPQAYKYLNWWRIITPPNYSVMITQPFGFQNTNFSAIPAIVDTDKSTTVILPPIWIKKGFVGVIEKGTPIVQVTPFKRENWQSEYSSLKDGEYQIIQDKNFNSTLVNHYIRKVWSRKIYR